MQNFRDKRPNGGFITAIIIIIIAIIILKFVFGFSIIDFLKSPRVGVWIAYVKEVAIFIWDHYLSGVAHAIWNLISKLIN